VDGRPAEYLHFSRKNPLTQNNNHPLTQNNNQPVLFHDGTAPVDWFYR